PPTPCRWRHDWRLHGDTALHRPCVGGGTIGGYTGHTQPSALHRPRVGGGTIGGYTGTPPSTDPVSAEARLAATRAHTQPSALHRPRVGGGTIGGYRA